VEGHEASRPYAVVSGEPEKEASILKAGDGGAAYFTMRGGAGVYGKPEKFPISKGH